jgi:hypothetical protein
MKVEGCHLDQIIRELITYFQQGVGTDSLGIVLNAKILED